MLTEGANWVVATRWTSGRVVCESGISGRRRKGRGIEEGKGFMIAPLATPTLVTGAQASVLLQRHVDTLGVKPIVANLTEDAMLG